MGSPEQGHFFATATLPGLSGTRSTSTVTDLRLDPVSGVGIQFDIDWIRAVPAPGVARNCA